MAARPTPRYYVLHGEDELTRSETLADLKSTFVSNVSRVLSFGLFLPFMAYGVWLSVRESAADNLPSWLRRPEALWLAFFLVHNATYLAVWGAPRYRLPTDSVMVIFAALALVRIGQRVSGLKES